jgi:hypothetical protein
VQYVHRSWTSFGIYEATFARVDGGGRRIVRVVAERDPERYRSTDDKVDRVFLELLITGYLLDQPAPELSAEFRALSRAAWGRPAAPDLGE